MERTTYSVLVGKIALVGLFALFLALSPVSVIAQTASRDSDPPKADTKAKTDGTAAKAAGAEQGKSPAVTAPKTPAKAPSKPVSLTRWVDFQAGSVQLRYRHLETSAKKVTAQQGQDAMQFKGRFKFDKKAQYSVTAVAATGNGFTSGWNNTGWGTGDYVKGVYVKQLYFSAAPIKGTEVSFGSMAPWRGESTEITTWDNDGYLSGERVSVKRPKEMYFDEVGFTMAYFGDLTRANFFLRSNRLLDEPNFFQYFASKKINKYLTASGDYTRQVGVPFVHAALTAKVPAVIVDSVKYEQYFRYGAKHGAGFAVYGEKNVTKKFSAGFGYATIDPNFTTVNADRFARGQRVYEQFTFKLIPELSFSVFATQAFGNDYTIPNKYRFDAIVNYNVLASVQRAGYFK